ncbi:protein LplB [Clostridia bacterium]|nr:protein LplB [Clostridia bacterium]
MTRQMRLKALLRSLRTDGWLYVMLIPGLIYTVIFKYLPMWGVTIAFKEYSIFRGFDASPWVGLQNFIKLFASSGFRNALRNNIIISLQKLIFGFPTPILLSLLINEVRKPSMRKAFQTAMILPNFVSWIVINGLLFAIFSTRSGAIIGVQRALGYTGAAANVLGDKAHFRILIIVSYLWKSGGFGTIIYLAAIAGISQELYEAAQIDGAGRLRQLWHVTLASLRSTIVMLFIFRVGELMYAGFDQIYAISNYLVVSVADIIDTFVFKLGLESRKFSQATAAGLFQSAIGFVLVLAMNAFAKRVDPDSGIL